MSGLTCHQIVGLRIRPYLLSLRPVRYNHAGLRLIHTSSRPKIPAMTPSISNGIANDCSNGVSPQVLFPTHANNHNNGNISRPYSSGPDAPAVETEFLIVGAGPAGASLACFLASYGKLTRITESHLPTDYDRAEGHRDQRRSGDC